MLGIDMGFWYGMLIIGGLTLTYCLAAWLVSPEKKDSAPKGEVA